MIRSPKNGTVNPLCHIYLRGVPPESQKLDESQKYAQRGARRCFDEAERASAATPRLGSPGPGHFQDQ